MNDYDDIINLPHYEPKHHPRMSMEARAAQFAPFAALNGHDDAINETARLTAPHMQMDGCDIDRLNQRMSLLLHRLSERQTISVTHFVADKLKQGGRYDLHTGIVRRYDDVNASLIFVDGTEIMLDSIADIDGEMFSDIP